MTSDLYWIDAPPGLRLATMARPRAGDWLDDEVAHWRRSGVEIVVSLLESDEIAELGLEDERAACEAGGLRYLSFPVADRGLPDSEAAMHLAQDLARAGKCVAIHCRAGIGRASVMAAALLVSAGVPPATALAAIERARGLSVPDTEAQRAWVMGLGDAFRTSRLISHRSP